MKWKIVYNFIYYFLIFINMNDKNFEGTFKDIKLIDENLYKISIKFDKNVFPTCLDDFEFLSGYFEILLDDSKYYFALSDFWYCLDPLTAFITVKAQGNYSLSFIEKVKNSIESKSLVSFVLHYESLDMSDSNNCFITMWTWITRFNIALKELIQKYAIKKNKDSHSTYGTNNLIIHWDWKSWNIHLKILQSLWKELFDFFAEDNNNYILNFITKDNVLSENDFSWRFTTYLENNDKSKLISEIKKKDHIFICWSPDFNRSVETLLIEKFKINKKKIKIF